MGFFKMREPHRFNHKYIFVDERKEKLDKIFAELDKGNYGEANRLTNEYNIWYAGLDAEDQAKADIVAAPYNLAVELYNYANGYDDYYCY